MRSQIRAWGLVLSAMAVSPAYAQSASQFDVVCTDLMLDQYETDGPEPIFRSSRPQSFHYRVDLARGEFCEIGCRQIHSLRTSELPSEINLSTGRGDVTLNRLTGQFEFEYEGQNVRWEAAGQCRREPFSGFPEAMF